MSDKTYPISEIFGPTIQGEGPHIGKFVNFVRFAGCDFDCSWCDTRYAVNSKYEGWKRDMMTSEQIVSHLDSLGGNAGIVVLSGGNPLFFLDRELIVALHNEGYAIDIETQGSGDLNKLRMLNPITDTIVISPKGPSSGMQDRYGVATMHDLVNLCELRRTYFKFVVFNPADLEWAAQFYAQVPAAIPYLSIGTQAGWGRVEILNSLDLLIDKLKHDKRFADFTILPQLHVLLWGNKRGV